MLTSLAFIFLVGLSLSAICKKLNLPGLVGMLLTGIFLGPYVFNLLDKTILGISSELRQIALIIILIKAGLSLNLSDLKRVGRPALLMAFLPASFEILAYVIFAPALLNVSRLEAALMGTVLGAVSPAVVVPRMVKLIEEKKGTDKSIPQMILAGASLDDIYVITLFSTFLAMSIGDNANILDLANIPISIGSGVLLGALFGVGLSWFFETAYSKDQLVRNSLKVIIILGVSFLLMSIEIWLKDKLALSGLLAVISMAAVIRIRSVDIVSDRLSEKYGKLWLAAEVLLFVLVGAAVDIRYTLDAGLAAVLMIAIALFIRSIGVFISLLATKLNMKERIFCVFAYIPKATVQAAIGSVPLAMGLSCGNIILSVAVLAILITAPLGALAIDLSYKKLLVSAE